VIAAGVNAKATVPPSAISHVQTPSNSGQRSRRPFRNTGRASFARSSLVALPGKTENLGVFLHLRIDREAAPEDAGEMARRIPDREMDWSRFDDHRRIRVVGNQYHQPTLLTASEHLIQREGDPTTSTPSDPLQQRATEGLQESEALLKSEDVNRGVDD
jgi:hypothetical protein